MTFPPFKPGGLTVPSPEKPQDYIYSPPSPRIEEAFFKSAKETVLRDEVKEKKRYDDYISADLPYEEISHEKSNANFEVMDSMSLREKLKADLRPDETTEQEQVVEPDEVLILVHA